jgi:hypothetical protein
MSKPDACHAVWLVNHHSGQRLKFELIDLAIPAPSYRLRVHPVRYQCPKYYVYVLRPISIKKLYVALTDNMAARLDEQHSLFEWTQDIARGGPDLFLIE